MSIKDFHSPFNKGSTVEEIREGWMIVTRSDKDLKPQAPTSRSHYSSLQNPPVDSHHTPNKVEIPCQGGQNSVP